MYLVGSVVLVALAGCGHSLFQMQTRAPWRHEAEAACLKAGAVKEGPTLVRISPIDGPGQCGADYPLKVAALGSTSALGFADDLRPPGSIPNAGPSPTLRWQPGPPPASTASPARMPSTESYPPAGRPAPLSLNPPGIDELLEEDAMAHDHGAPAVAMPDTRRAPRFDAPPPPLLPRAQSVPLGPSRALTTAGIGPAALKPAATLACPIVSALETWMDTSVQPSALRWFGQPVVEIKQISAYSCRGMNGQPGAHISEHAFGNALDIAGFILADGRKVMVQKSWNASPEEQGFLRDVQGGACAQFTTVLAPGSNKYHYNHIHVDLMRRKSGRIICQPRAISGEVAAARAAEKQGMVARRFDPTVTGSIAARNTKNARAAQATAAKRGADWATDSEEDEWIEDDGPRPSAED